MKPTEPWIQFDNVELRFSRTTVLKNVSFSVAKGEKTGLIGPNGSGKTTLVRTLMSLHTPFRGVVRTAPRMTFGYAPQRKIVDILVPLTVYEYVTLDTGNRYDQALFDQWSEKLALKPIMDTPFSCLSGGQKQRALLLRAMLPCPDCLILDEPTDNLDIKGEQDLLHLVDEFCLRNQVTLFIISHSINSVINHVDRIFYLNNSRLYEVSSTEPASLQKSLSSIFDTPIGVQNINGQTIVFGMDGTL